MHFNFSSHLELIFRHMFALSTFTLTSDQPVVCQRPPTLCSMMLNYTQHQRVLSCWPKKTQQWIEQLEGKTLLYQ